MPQTTAGGTRYSVHDHMSDFSRPEVACTECHDADDQRLAKTPAHRWNFRPVRFPEPLTLEQACERCHADKGTGWVQEKLKGLRRKL